MLTIYLLVGFIRGIPPALDEAASIDGAGRTRVLVYVLLPLMRPALVTVSVVGAVFVWNEFLIALASLPVIIAYIFGPRFFLRGLVAGALK